MPFLSARVFLFAVAVPGLVRLPLPVLTRLLEPRKRPSAARPEDVERVASRVEEVLRAGGPWVRPGCLTRGFTRYFFLRRVGLDVDLCFGAALDARRAVTGHCWLERRGEPYLEEEGDPRTAFVEMHRISSSTSSAP